MIAGLPEPADHRRTVDDTRTILTVPTARQTPEGLTHFFVPEIVQTIL